MSIPTTQKVWRVVRRGHPSQALEFQDVPVPSSYPAGNVLIKVRAAALNPVGYKLMRLLPNFMSKRPHIAEHDIEGVVVDGNGTEFKAGDEVLGIIDAPTQQKFKQGALAQYVFVPAEFIVPVPPNTSRSEAAGLSLVGLTAAEGLYDILKIQSGQRIFINGGNSAVGAIAIQLAKATGCHVTTSCSGAKAERVKGFGADEVVDYTIAPLHQQLSSKTKPYHFDHIFDAIGSTALFTHSEAYLDPKGSCVSVGPEIKGVFGTLLGMVQTTYLPTWLGGANRKYSFFLMTPSKKNLQILVNLFAEGKLHVPVDSEYSFEDTIKAYERIMTNRANGKVIVNIDISE